MCLILISWREDARYPCVVAANRDERHDRPAQRADWWRDAPILAGRDLAAGGTWLGISRSGRFAALTNFRGAPPKPAAPSRGLLVSQFLASERSVEEELRHLSAVCRDYGGFNLIFCDGERLGVFESMRGDGRELGAGIYGLSNHLLDTPWPKVRTAKSRLRAALDDAGEEAAILELLRDSNPAPDGELPRTGIDPQWERLLSSAFILSPTYGTRCSTVLRIDAAGTANFDEWSWDAGGNCVGHARHRFALSGARIGA